MCLEHLYLHGSADGLCVICVQPKGQVSQDYGVFFILSNIWLLYLAFVHF